MNEQQFEELAAGHVLGALSIEDERAFADALAAHPEWAHHVDRDREVAARLADIAPSVEVPASVRDALFARIAVAAQDPTDAPARAASADRSTPEREDPAPPDETAGAPPEEGEADPDIVVEPPTETAAPAKRRWGSRAWFALAASLALLIGVGGTTAVLVNQIDRPAAVIALERIEAATDSQVASGQLADGGDVTLHWSETVGEAVLTADSMPALAADQSFELWYVRDGAAISAGAFEPADEGTTALLQGEMHAGDVIAVTVEPVGGSPTGQPTSEPIIAIPTA